MMIDRLKMLLPMMITFFIGGLLGASAGRQFGSLAIAFNFMIFAGTGLLYTVYISNTKHISLIKAIFMADSFEDARGHLKKHFNKDFKKDDPEGNSSPPDVDSRGEFQMVDDGHTANPMITLTTDQVEEEDDYDDIV